MVSIIFSTHNQKNLLLSSLKSLGDLDYNEYEVIVTDNNSDDGTAFDIEQKYPRVRLLKSEYDLGIAKGYNMAVEKCRGDFLVVLKPGIKINFENIQKGVEYLKEHNDINLVTGQLIETKSNQARIYNKVGLSKKRIKVEEETEVKLVDGYMIINIQKKDRVPFWLDEKYIVGYAFLDYCQEVARDKGKIMYLPSIEARGERELLNKLKRKAYKKDAFKYSKKWLNKLNTMIIKLLK
jgi:glycosyltransferase involved in cell wall biosynthesis